MHTWNDLFMCKIKEREENKNIICSVFSFLANFGSSCSLCLSIHDSHCWLILMSTLFVSRSILPRASRNEESILCFLTPMIDFHRIHFAYWCSLDPLMCFFHLPLLMRFHFDAEMKNWIMAFTCYKDKTEIWSYCCYCCCCFFSIHKRKNWQFSWPLGIIGCLPAMTTHYLDIEKHWA